MAEGFIGAGNVLMQNIGGSGPAGYFDAGECIKFAIKPNSERKDMESRGRDSYGQVMATVSLQRPADISITFRSPNKDNLAQQFMGEIVEIEQGAATVTDEAATLVLGRYHQLANQNISATDFVVTSSDDTTTYVKDRDYKINYRLGLIQALEGGSIPVGTPVKIAYSALAMSGSRINGARKTSIRVGLLLDGKNLADDSNVLCEAYEAVLAPDAEFDFLGDDWAEFTLSGTLVTPSGRVSPFHVDLRD
ncbi:phage tail tube protein [Chitiniphilus eburneus]|uniref:Uncharacterized protein n=1 Tax=Chitiniphilus eburneus TaxID=2571148 RepID=A0A4U0PXC6_9NEIS|nr:hypothetical protein [Chitiniphilus eburneus]TJZ73187.1 hypothetical protein FAZ21_11255 [Chitiniphilus eburneus]